MFADDDPVAPQGFRFVAIASVGPNAGQVLAADDIDPNRFLELPPDAFGEGSDGVVDRVRDVGSTVIGYVDEDGEPVDLAATAAELGVALPPIVPRFDDIDGDGFGTLVSASRRRPTAGRGPSTSFVTRPTAPRSRGRRRRGRPQMTG